MREKIKKFFTEYSREKVLALILTFVVWVFMISGAREIRDYSVKLEVKTSDDVVLISDVIETVHIKANGSIFNFAGIVEEDLVLKIDLSSKSAGVHTRFLDASMMPFEDGITIEKIFPSELVFNISSKSKKDVTVDPWIEGQLPLGWKLKQWSVEPETIEVEGPQNEVNELETITTEKVILGSIRENTTRTVKVRSAVPYIKPVEKQTVKVNIEVERDIETKIFSKIKIVLENGKEAEISPSEIDVTLKGPKDILQKMESEKFTVFVKDLDQKEKFKADSFYIENLHNEVEIIQTQKPLEISVIKR
jgi:YbbR domain-containing protein